MTRRSQTHGTRSFRSLPDQERSTTERMVRVYAAGSGLINYSVSMRHYSVIPRPARLFFKYGIPLLICRARQGKQLLTTFHVTFVPCSRSEMANSSGHRLFEAT